MSFPGSFNSKSVFGEDGINLKVETNDSTSGSSWKTYANVTLTVTDSSEDNTYRINADFLWGHDSASNDIRVRLRIDGNSEKEILIEPKDAGNDQRIQNNILLYLTNLSEGGHTIRLQYKPKNSNRVSKMYRAEIEAWRTK